jgi:hypothetical protein
VTSLSHFFSSLSSSVLTKKGIEQLDRIDLDIGFLDQALYFPKVIVICVVSPSLILDSLPFAVNGDVDGHNRHEDQL